MSLKSDREIKLFFTPWAGLISLEFFTPPPIKALLMLSLVLYQVPVHVLLLPLTQCLDVLAGARPTRSTGVGQTNLKAIGRHIG